MAEAVRARLWADPARKQFWLIPEDAALGAGPFRIEGVGGAKKQVEEAALARYAIPADEARRRVAEEMTAYMAKVRPQAKPMADLLRGFAKGLGIDASAFEVPTDDAAVEMFMNPNGVKDYVDAATAEPDTVIEPRKPLTPEQQAAVDAIEKYAHEPGLDESFQQIGKGIEQWQKNLKKPEGDA